MTIIPPHSTYILLHELNEHNVIRNERLSVALLFPAFGIIPVSVVCPSKEKTCLLCPGGFINLLFLKESMWLYMIAVCSLWKRT